MPTTLPIPQETLADLCDHRAKALDLFQRAVDLFEAAREEARRASPTDRYVGPGRQEFESLAHWPKEFVGKVRENLDRSMWRHMMKASAIGNFMDAKARDDFENTLRENPPEASFDNVAATLSMLAAKTPDIVKRGVVELFQRLDNRYKVNRAFRIGNRLKREHAKVWEILECRLLPG